MKTNTKQDLNRQIAATKIRDDLAEREEDPEARLRAEIREALSSSEPGWAQDLINELKRRFP